MDNHNEGTSDRFLDMAAKVAGEDYAAAFEDTLNCCLSCDLFAWNCGRVTCLLKTDPVRCGGPYRRHRR